MRRHRALLVAALVLAAGYTASEAASRLLNGKARVLDSDPHVLNGGANVLRDNHRADGSAVRWPLQGQAALVLGDSRLAASPHEQPAPIASLAKVMTAYLTLKRYPLSGAQAGALGMHHTLYTDPSGFDPGTESTSADQLRVFRQAMRSPVFRQIVSMASVTLPVAGTLQNFNPLIAEGYAGKTGSDSAAGGCLAFFTHVTVRSRRQTAVGVVMGQGAGSNTSEILAAAGEAAQQLVASATHATPAHLIATPPMSTKRTRGEP